MGVTAVQPQLKVIRRVYSIESAMHVCEMLGDFQSETVSEKMVNSKLIRDPLKCMEINVENIETNLVYDFTDVLQCQDCDSILNQDLSSFYLKCLLRKLDCLIEEEEKSGFRNYIIQWMQNYSVNNIQGFHLYKEHGLYRELVAKQLENEVGYIPKSHIRTY